MNSTAIVLISPLNWGLGHATRCIPVVNELLLKGASVVIAAEGHGKKILEDRFPHITFINIPGIKIRYPRKGNMVMAMLTQMPSILRSIKNEHQTVAEVIKKHGITHIISDNRYGLWSAEVRSAFICHQINIQVPAYLSWMQSIIKFLHKKYISKFDELWIPDIPASDNLSGILSDHHHIKIPVHHIGPLSRFAFASSSKEKKFDIIALLSGPEPQRTEFERSVLAFMQSGNNTCMLVRGLPDSNENLYDDKIKILSAISDEELLNSLHPDTLLISRPGYSTIMDLAKLNHRKIIFVPTPGQTEQEYLAKHIGRMFGVTVSDQEQPFPPLTSVAQSKPFTLSENNLLSSTITEFLKSDH